MTERVARPRVFRGDRLKQVREARGYTQNDINEYMGWDEGRCSNYERNIGEPTPHNIVQLAQLLGVSVEYLVGLTDDENGHLQESDLSAVERDLVSAFRRGDFKDVFTIVGKQSAKVP